MRFVVFLLLASFASPAQADLVDRVVAVIEDQLVLDSEVRLEQELAALDDTALPFWEPSRGKALDRLVDAAVVRVAASDVALYQPSDEDVRQRREAVRAQFEDRRQWTACLQTHGLTEDSLGVVLRRRMVVERYLSRNIQVAIEERGPWKRASVDLISALRERAKVRLIDEES